MVCSGAPNPTCSYLNPSPGASGARCKLDGDCASGLCAGERTGQDPVCSELCFPSDRAPCAAGQRCAADLDHAGAYACFEEHAGGGCSQRPRTGGGAAELIWLGLALAARGYRRWRVIS
jgi:hypothetical protein